MREGDSLNAVNLETRTPPHEDNTRFTAVNNTNNGSGGSIIGGGHHQAGVLTSTQPSVAQRRPLAEDWHKIQRPSELASQEQHSRSPAPYSRASPAVAETATHDSLEPANGVQHPRPTAPSQSGQSGAQVNRHESNSPQGQKRKRTPEPTSAGQRPNPAQQHQQSNQQRIGEDAGLTSQMVAEFFDNDTATDDKINLQSMKISEGSPQATGDRRRKRQFANRVKTGCVTCRRRKKKCDEGKPECSNCKRGGFVCEGYTNRVSWPVKGPEKSVPPTPIPSRVDVAASASTSPMPTSPRNEPTSTSHLRLTAEQNALNSIPPQQSSLTFERDPSADISPITRAPTLLQQSRDVVVSRNHLGPAPTEPNHVFPQGANPRPPAKFGSDQTSEKHRMLSGQPFNFYSPELEEAREKCKLACYRFNNALAMNISKDEQARLLLAIFRPSGQDPGAPGGIIEAVRVESPFNCTYGANMSIGRDVRIGPRCVISDACPVIIKARTIIDDDVRIYTTYRDTDPKKRHLDLAKPVVIEEDCWIGARATIMPGVTIHRGAVISPGSIVETNVPSYTIAAGHPAIVCRGIYPIGADT